MSSEGIRVVKAQFIYKLKAYDKFIDYLFLYQLIALLISFNATGMQGSGFGYTNITSKFYTEDIFIIINIILSFVIGFVITNKECCSMDFTFVSTRVTSFISNIMYLLVFSATGSLISKLSGMLQRVILYFYSGDSMFKGSILNESLRDFLTGFTALFLYMVLFSTIGLVSGALYRWKKIFAVVLPLIPIILFKLNIDGIRVLSAGVGLFFGESRLYMLAIKVMAAALLLYAVSIPFIKRRDVRI